MLTAALISSTVNSAQGSFAALAVAPDAGVEGVEPVVAAGCWPAAVGCPAPVAAPVGVLLDDEPPPQAASNTSNAASMTSDSVRGNVRVRVRMR
jgi:hypothetical protein